MPTNVYWHHGRRLCADQTMLDEMFSGPEFVHHSTFWDDTLVGGVIIVPVTASLGDVQELNAIMAHKKWVVLCIVGDEESVFPRHLMKHPNMRIWLMSPVRQQNPDPARFLINGSWPGLHDAIKKFSPQPRTFDWFFAGQVTHERRYQCVKQLRQMPNGHLLETPGFTQGMPREEYYKFMLSAKVIPCPSGPVELSTARVAEALECGCVPIVDGRTPHPEYHTAPAPGYWTWFFGEVPPFPVIYDWGALPIVMSMVLADWENMSQRCYKWWQAYKAKIFAALMQDVAELRGAV